MPVKLIITDHAYQRGKERLSFSHETLERIAHKAFKEGVRHSETKGQLNKYLTKIYFQHGNANNVRVYGEDADFEYEPLARIHKEKINMIDGPGGKVLAKIDVIVLDQEY